MRRKLVAGNWKMNGLLGDLDFLHGLSALQPEGAPADVLLCPPVTLVSAMASSKPDWLMLGGQDCAVSQSGAHTGDISAAMLADLGCSHVIVGHSERRTDHAEDDALVRAKAQSALEAGLTPILCVGETLAQREAGEAQAVVKAQMLASLPESVAADQIIIAYEPVWAIGTGRTATPQDAQDMHAALRAAWPGADKGSLRILYGGSMSADNAEALLHQADIDGGLVGGASLKAESFSAILQSLR